MTRFLNIDTARAVTGTSFAIGGAVINFVMKAFGYFEPLQNFFVYVLLFIVIDFVTGVWASKKRADKKKEKFVFSSTKAWETIEKTCFCLITIFLAWLLDEKMLPHTDVNLEAYVCAFICGVEFWSFLENASEISNYPIFRWVKKFTKEKMKEKLNDTANVLDELK